MFEKERAYLRNNPEGYWFKAKLYGWGWVPVKWQGWAVVALYVAGVLLCGAMLDENASTRDVAFTFILPIAILTGLVIRICYAKGERPRWQWGVPKDPAQSS